MKRLLLGVVLAVMLVLLFGGVLPVLADDGDNFEKAGEQALKEREGVLVEEKARLERIVQVLVEDRVVTKDEMIAFRNEVKAFNQLKERYDKDLKLYEKKTSTFLEPGYQLAIDSYFKYDGLFKDDLDKKAARVFFASETGQDVMIERGIVIDGLCICFMFAIVIFGAVTVGCIKTKHVGGAVICGLFCIGFLLVLLLG